jgi:hypothetical protein
MLYVTVLKIYIINYGYLFGTATYVDYSTFSHLNPITNPTPLPNAILTIGATACNPNYWGSHVYPNYWGSRTQPLLSGLPHATLTVGAAGHGLVGAGGEVGLCPRSSCCTVAACTARSQLILRARSALAARAAYLRLLFCTAKNI